MIFDRAGDLPLVDSLAASLGPEKDAVFDCGIAGDFRQQIRKRLPIGIRAFALPGTQRVFVFNRGGRVDDNFFGPGMVTARGHLHFRRVPITELLNAAGDENGCVSRQVRRGKHKRHVHAALSVRGGAK